MNDRLKSQIDFLIGADALKGISRKTSIVGGARLENSAEHSWHVILMAMTLSEYSNEPIDLFHILKMLAVHDLGEIGAGDTFHYDKNAGASRIELNSLENLLKVLPEDQKSEYLKLWVEFEHQNTPEAKFAAAIDRIWPCIQNFHNHGGSWLSLKITLERALEKNSHIKRGSDDLWSFIESLLREANDRNLMYKDNHSA
jgi:putative hydrolase of HD superfamily